MTHYNVKHLTIWAVHIQCIYTWKCYRIFIKQFEDREIVSVVRYGWRLMAESLTEPQSETGLRAWSTDIANKKNCTQSMNSVEESQILRMHGMYQSKTEFE